jgi:NACalpha-BTF3-like transcription factor
MDISNIDNVEQNEYNYYTYDAYFKDYLKRNNIEKDEFASYDRNKRASILLEAQNKYKEEYPKEYEIELNIRTKKYEEQKKEIIEQEKKQKEIRNEEMIKLIMRQTDYDYDTCKDKLKEHNGNYIEVIKYYISDGKNNTNKNQQIKQKSTNQQIYSQIRSFMDYGSRKYEEKKSIEERKIK